MEASMQREPRTGKAATSLRRGSLSIEASPAPFLRAKPHFLDQSWTSKNGQRGLALAAGGMGGLPQPGTRGSYLTWKKMAHQLVDEDERKRATVATALTVCRHRSSQRPGLALWGRAPRSSGR